MNENLNNYHFGRHVFEYFPWYKYTDINSMPEIDRKIRQDFVLLNSPITNFWTNEYESIYSYIDTLSMSEDSRSIIVKNNIIRYGGFEETVNSWEDIEKIRLRCILGTKEKAEKYLNTLDFYIKNHDIILDMIYSQTGEDIEVSCVSLSDFVNRNDFEVYNQFIEDSDVYSVLKKCKNHSSFLNSVYSYYEKNKFLSIKQIDAVKKTLHPLLLEKLKKKTPVLLYVKTNLVPNVNRVTNYFDEIGIKYKKFTNFLLVHQ